MSTRASNQTTSTNWAASSRSCPEGWTFETKVLDEDLSLDTSRAGGWAAIMRDELGCAYQGWVRRGHQRQLRARRLRSDKRNEGT